MGKWEIHVTFLLHLKGRGYLEVLGIDGSVCQTQCDGAKVSIEFFY